MEMMSLLSIYSIRIAVFSNLNWLLATCTSGAALLHSKCVMVKWGAEMISPALLTNIPKRSKECHERFHLDMGGWTKSSDESSTESEAPKPNPPKKS